jgi:nucleolar protein 58
VAFRCFAFVNRIDYYRSKRKAGKMFLLFETASGYALFKVIKEKKLAKCENVLEEYSDADKLSQLLSLQKFSAFKDTDEAVKATSSMISGKLSKKMKKLIQEEVEGDTLAVADSKLAALIKDKLDVSCSSTTAVQQLMSCIRSQMDSLIPDLGEIDNDAMQLALAHGFVHFISSINLILSNFFCTILLKKPYRLSRFKLKFSADKVDMMIIHAVSLLDDLDKELNNYIMRCKEWYGWHYPELAKIVPDNEQYVKTILAVGMKENAVNADLSEILDENVAVQVKEMAELSMGTEVTDEDMLNIEHLCRNVLDLYEYRTQLFEYIKNRMMAIAPNLAILVGELVGARLISKAGSLINLAKQPASTVQILGAEKALFRALKTRHDTPKYGLIYHAQLIGLSNQKIKGKMSRALAAKASLSCRMDALGEGSTNELGLGHKARLEAKLKFLEEGGLRRVSKGAKKNFEQPKFEHKSKILKYKDSGDFAKVEPKRKFEEEEAEEAAPQQTLESPVKKIKSEKKDKKRKQKPAEEEEEVTQEYDEQMTEEVVQEAVEEAEAATPAKKKKKNKKKKQEDAEDDE